jgi:hypothetical protein
MKAFLRILALLLLTIATRQSLFSTAQHPDVLYYQGDTFSIFSNPLEDYYTEETRPEHFFPERVACLSTGCWRGYIAHWTIENDILYLVRIETCCWDKKRARANLSHLFGDKCIYGRVKADWFTGGIMAPQGERIEYIHMGYESIYERELIFTFEKGHMVQDNVLDNTKSKRSDYESDADKRNAFIFSHINWDQLPDSEEEVKLIAVLWTDPSGKIEGIEIRKSTNDSYNDAVVHAIQQIPDWTVFYHHGEFVPNSWVIAVKIDPAIRQQYGR